jgi:hypothetical protein
VAGVSAGVAALGEASDAEAAAPVGGAASTKADGGSPPMVYATPAFGA